MRQESAQDICRQQGISSGVDKLLERVPKLKDDRTSILRLKKEAQDIHQSAKSLSGQRAAQVQAYDAILGMMEALVTGQTREVEG